MKKIFIAAACLFIPSLAIAAIINQSSCPDYCANGTFFSGGTAERAGACAYPNKEVCKYGCDGRDKCLAGKDCPSKCEDNIYYYRGFFSARAKDCQYAEKKCEYGCTNRGCEDEPEKRECNEYCEDGTFYSNGSYDTLVRKCEYKNQKKCLCDSEGEKCLDVECADRCLNGVAYFNGAPAADGKCKYEKEEKCQTGCDQLGKGCVDCKNRCYNNNYYYNGIYQNAGAGKKTCVYGEKICDAGCDDNEGCKKCQKDADCAEKNICKNGSILGGWCSAGTPADQLEVISGGKYSESGCYYNLIGACPTGTCNPIHKDMCGIIIGPAVYENLADGKIKPIAGVKVSAVWKNSSGSESLPERVTDETGHAYFTDEELYKYFPDKNASLEIIASIENSGKGFQISPVAETKIIRVVEVGNVSTYKVNLAFGNFSEKNSLDLFFSNGDPKKEKTYNKEIKPSSSPNIGDGVMKWLKGLRDFVTDVFNRP